MKKSILTVSSILIFGWANNMLAVTAFTNDCARISQKTGIPVSEIKQYFTEQLNSATIESYAKSVGQPVGKIRAIREYLLNAGVITTTTSGHAPTPMTENRMIEVGEAILSYFVSTGELTTKKIDGYATTIAKNARVLIGSNIKPTPDQWVRTSDVFAAIEKQEDLLNTPPLVYSETVFGSLEFAKN